MRIRKWDLLDTVRLFKPAKPEAMRWCAGFILRTRRSNHRMAGSVTCFAVPG